MALCIAGDTILVGQGHSELFTTGGDTIAVANVTVRGIGEGDSRPLFTATADADELTVNAAGVVLDNLRFRAGDTAETSCIIWGASADGCTIKNCSFIEGEAAGTDEFTDVMVLNTSTAYLTVDNCTAFSTGTDGGTFINLDAATIAGLRVTNCTIFGDYDEAAIWWAAAIPTNVHFANNTITNVLTGQSCIEGSGAATGMIENNHLSGDTYGAILLGGSTRMSGNKQTIAAGSAAIDVPLIPGQTYVSVASVDEVSATLFDVQNGEIIIYSIIAAVDVLIGATPTTCTLEVNADDGAAWDLELSDAVSIVDDVAGTRWIFTDANPGTLTPLIKGTGEGSAMLSSPMFIPEGLIHQAMSADPGGASGDHITWTMVYTPVTEGVVVVPGT